MIDSNGPRAFKLGGFFLRAAAYGAVQHNFTKSRVWTADKPALPWHHDNIMSVTVITWWYFLCAAAAFNVTLLFVSAIAFRRRSRDLSPEAHSMRRWQLLLSAVYVFGCAFRSIYLVYDVPRICVVDSWLSSVMVGRSVATIAELCFVAQWALILRETSRSAGSVIGNVTSLALIPLIVIAEACSWYSVLTTSNIGHVAEESIWALCVALLIASLFTIWPRSTADRRPLLLACCIVGSIYVGYMSLVDVPMYWSRWIGDELSGRSYLSIAQGAHDVAVRWVVSHRWQDWRNELVWMSLYFSVAVWISIALVHSPVPQIRVAAGKPIKGSTQLAVSIP
jgi:hypothetical protein